MQKPVNAEFRFVGQNHIKLLRKGEKNTNGPIELPRDCWILDEILKFEPEAVFTGSFADHIHAGQIKFQIKDIDAEVSRSALDLCMRSNASKKFVKKFRENNLLCPQIFKEDGTLQEPGPGILVDGLRYPINLQMLLGQMVVELFVKETKSPVEETVYEGRKLKIVSREQRIKMIKSMIGFRFSHGFLNEWLSLRRDKLRDRLRVLESLPGPT